MVRTRRPSMLPACGLVVAAAAATGCGPGPTVDSTDVPMGGPCGAFILQVSAPSCMEILRESKVLDAGACTADDEEAASCQCGDFPASRNCASLCSSLSLSPDGGCSCFCAETY